jgi:hypothetical protein
MPTIKIFTNAKGRGHGPLLRPLTLPRNEA